jgi:hypothetical protein
MNVLNKQMLLHKNLICSKKNNEKHRFGHEGKKKMGGKLNYILH